MINIDDLTIKQIREISQLVNCEKSESKSPLVVGKPYFLRTVTMYYTGKLINIYEDFLEFETCCWIVDTGRFSDFIQDKEANEIEPFINNVLIPKGSIIDITEWNRELPEKRK